MKNRDRFPNRHTERCTGCGAGRSERHDDECRGHLGTGIRHIAAARRALRRRFNQGPAQAPVIRPGARFYVTALVGGRTAWLLGPYTSHIGAQSAVPRARRRLAEDYPGTVPWAALGTASTRAAVVTAFGR